MLFTVLHSGNATDLTWKVSVQTIQTSFLKKCKYCQSEM